MLPMLSLMEIPDHVDQMYAEYKELAKDVYAYVGHSGKNERVPAATNLCEHAEKKSVFFIEEGDIIIKEGNESRNIFEMVSGSVDASKNNRQLGIIHEGEVFGEVSFFTGKRRTATVTALEKCMVRVIHQDNFADMIRHNPSFVISISETLAKRIVNLNQKLTNNIEDLNIEFEELKE